MKKIQQDNSTSKQQKIVQPEVLFVYNVSPGTKQFAYLSTIPNAVHYTPFHQQIDTQIYSHSDDFICRKCGSYLNKYSEINQKKKLWICCICKQGNSFNSNKNIQGSIKTKQTYEVSIQRIDMSLNRKQKFYILVIDLCVSSKQMQAIKKSLVQFIKAKAQENYGQVNLINRLALITYSRHIYCYQFTSLMNTVVCIGGHKQYDTQSLNKFLDIVPQQSKDTADKYFANLKNDYQKIIKIINKIQAEGHVQFDNDPSRRCRSKRSFGQAIRVALNISQNINNTCRIINLIGGPCTYGPGSTIGTSFKQQMRSINEFQNSQNIIYFDLAVKYYQQLKSHAEGRRTIIDSFIFSIQQTGLTQMYDLLRSTGGLLVLGEQFSGQLNIFPKSFAKAYINKQDNQMICSFATSCTVSISCSSDVKINGAVCPCKPLQIYKGKNYVSEKVIGHGQTAAWYIGGMDCHKTLTFMYQLAGSKATQSAYYIQFKTVYKDYWGFNKRRVTTVKRLWDTNSVVIAQNFDQQAAMVALARWYLYKAQYEPRINLRTWLDKLLVKWATNFANYIKGDQQSFSLPEKMKFLPQFVYHFRRNAIVRRIGLSLDQLTYHAHSLNCQTVQHSITIIQPALLSYTIEKPQPSPVRLQEQQMKNQAILLLDTHFHVLLWYGSNIEYWQKQQYHKQKQYQHVKTLLQAPQQDIQYLLNSRFPYPGYYKTSTGHSKQRILKSKISPISGSQQNENTLTDDKSVYAFMKALIQIIVNVKT